MMSAMEKSQRIRLRKSAHALKPVVIIGNRELADSVIAEIDQALNAHELIKIRVNAESKEARQVLIDQISEKTDAVLIHTIGHIAVFYRKNQE